jgi:hypothetical protein
LRTSASQTSSESISNSIWLVQTKSWSARASAKDVGLISASASAAVQYSFAGIASRCVATSAIPTLVAGLDDVAAVGEAIEQRPRSCLLLGRIQGAGLRANQDNDGMAFRQGVADDQPSGSSRCTQTRTFMFDLDLHL